MRTNIHYDTEDLRKKDSDFLIHSWHDFEHMPRSLVITDSEGCYIYDSEGNKYLDAPAGMWCTQVGYGRKEIVDAVADQMRHLVYFSPFHQMTSPPTAELGAKLASLAPGDLNKVFLSGSGSDAVESAVRFALFYYSYRGHKTKRHVLSRIDSYHGSTYLTSSLSGKMSERSEYFDYLDEDDFVHLLPSPNPYFRPDGMSMDEFCDAKVADLENTILELGPKNVACFIAEPVMATGGLVIPPPGYQRRTLEVCRKYDVIYISDEVVTGFGRLGHFFASEPVFDIVPDIITCAKGLTSGYLPLAATIISERLFDAVSGAGAEGSVFAQGFTYSGHPVPCAAALKNIEIMERERLCEWVRELSPYFLERLQTLEELPIVGEVRGLGLMACVHCVADKKTKEPFPAEYEMGMRIDRHCQDRGLILRPLGNQYLIVLSPPLIINEEEIDFIVDTSRAGIEAATKELRDEGLWNG